MFDEINHSFAKNSLPQPAAPVAKAKFRHVGLALSFLLCVVAPIAVSAWYMMTIAADQFASRVGFSVRTQELEMPNDVLSGLGALSSGTTRDSDILYEFLQSQEIVEQVDAALDLRLRFSKPQNDPVFALDAAAPVEDLVKYWRRMVGVYYDSATGLIELRVRAFSPNDAVEIATETLQQASLMINRLSAIAQEDTSRHARDELNAAVARLKAARADVTAFRVDQNMVNPEANAQVQMSLLGSLQQQLAETLIDLDLMLENTREGDPRVANLRRRVMVIETRIAAERGKFGEDREGTRAFSELVGEFERLNVDLEYAQSRYLSSLTGYEKAVARAQQQSRYLATYLAPTRPQSAEFPQKELKIGMIALFSFLIWSVMSLIYYSAKDRR